MKDAFKTGGSSPPSSENESKPNKRYSVNGVPVCTGVGLEATKRAIQQAFELARQAPIAAAPRMSTPTHPGCESDTLTAASQGIPKPPLKRLKPLSEISAPFIRHGIKQLAVYQSTAQAGVGRAHPVAVPTETCEQLVAQAVRVVKRPLESEDRFDIGSLD